MDLEDKKYWPNKWIFILAAIGSAAGLGNLWRFPFLAYEHGGAAYVLALIVAYLVIGIPLLNLEVGLGQMTQKGFSDALGKIKKGWRYVGWAGLTVSFMVLTYYMGVVSWGLNYIKSSFTLEWGTDTGSFFFDNLLGLSEGVGSIGGFSWPVLVGLVLAWIFVYFAVRKGVESISKVVVWTATIPFVILIALIVRAVTLPGAGAGLSIFFVPDWSALADPQLWLAAFSQTFFSLSLALGIMIAYGSMRRKTEEIKNSVLMIVGGNLLVSIMSGIVIFGTLGYMAMEQGVEFSSVVEGGPSLAFVVFPKAISLMPAFSVITAVLFFGAFILLAIDSAFSIFEAVATPIKERMSHISGEKISTVISITGIVLGLLFATGAGLYILDILDHFLVNYAIVIMGLLEAVAVGWIWKGDKLKKFISERSKSPLGSWWTFSIKYLTPIFLTLLLIINFVKEIRSPYEGYPTWALIVFGVVPILLTPVVAYGIDKLTSKDKAEEELPRS